MEDMSGESDMSVGVFAFVESPISMASCALLKRMTGGSLVSSSEGSSAAGHPSESEDAAHKAKTPSVLQVVREDRFDSGRIMDSVFTCHPYVLN